MALIYTGLLAAALVIFGVGVYIVLRNELERSFDAALVANAEHAAGAFGQDIASSGQLNPPARLLEQFASTGGRVVLLDRTGAVLADSAPPGTNSLPLAAEDLVAADDHAHAVRQYVVNGDTRRLTLEPIPTAGGEIVGYVAWAASTRPMRDLLDSVAVALLIGGVLLVGIALIGGLILARRALSPVADVTDTARAISLSGDFAARVEAGSAGDEIGELAVAFNEMLAALEQNHQALQRFLADASHQLRSPLTTIRANLDLAQRELPAAERAAILADAHEEAERMGRLIGDLLALARAESGARLEFVPVELDALLMECIRQHGEAAPHVRMSIATLEPAVVDGDRDRLRELLGILLDNAARYTPEGGSVAAGLSVRDDWATVSVEDTGIGLEGEDRARLFERLYRGARAREVRPSGTGLGLAIARWIVDAHGGSIELTDRPGGGTVASVALPLRAPWSK